MIQIPSDLNPGLVPLAFLTVRLPVNVKPTDSRFLYNLEDDIVLRNSTRS